MKILQVAPYYPPYQGGQEYYVKRLVDSLQKRGHKVCVLTSDFPQNPQNKTENYIYKIPVFMRPFRNPIYKNIYSVISIIQELAEWADVIHTHNEHSMISMLTSLFVKSKPIVTTVHGKLRFGKRIPDLVESLYTHTLGRHVLNKAKIVIALTPDERQRLINLGLNPKKVIQIPNGIDISSLTEKSKNIDPTKYNIELNEHIILFVGALIIRKGVDVLIRSFDIIAKKDEKAHLYIVGNGEDAIRLKQIANMSPYSDRIHFLGRVEHDLLMYLYKIANVFVLPSRSEGLPTVIIEALAHGRKVVSSDLPSVRSIFKNLVRIAPLNEEEFAHAILEEIYNTKNNENEKINFVRNYLDWEKIVDKIEKVYQIILADQ